MTTLHLGVIEIPYGDKSGKTTGDVAEILEDKYHVMEVFYEDMGAELIAKALERSTLLTFEAVVQSGRNSDVRLTEEAEEELEEAFKHFLSLQQMDGVVGGVPTKAALKGVNHRFKPPYAKDNPERPSFIDTGQYEANFLAWCDSD